MISRVNNDVILGLTNDQKFDLCHRLVSSADQYPFIFALNCGQQPVNDRPIEIYLLQKY